MQSKNNKSSLKWDESISFLNAPHIIDLCTVVDFQLTDFGMYNFTTQQVCVMNIRVYFYQPKLNMWATATETVLDFQNTQQDLNFGLWFKVMQ